PPTVAALEIRRVMRLVIPDRTNRLDRGRAIAVVLVPRRELHDVAALPLCNEPAVSPLAVDAALAINVHDLDAVTGRLKLAHAALSRRKDTLRRRHPLGIFPGRHDPLEPLP